MRSFDGYKSQNRTNSVYSDATTVTDINFFNGRLTAAISGTVHQKKLMGFDHNVRIVNAGIITAWGKASHAVTLYNGTSNASNLIGTIRPITSGAKAVMTSVNATNCVIDRGDFITMLVSGASWANVRGLLDVETEPR